MSESASTPTTLPDTPRSASPTVHSDRRARLMERIGEDSALLVFANPVRNRSNDTEFHYRPNSDLWYLTGFEEPGAAILLLALSFNLVGDAFRDALDPTERGRH